MDNFKKDFFYLVIKGVRIPLEIQIKQMNGQVMVYSSYHRPSVLLPKSNLDSIFYT